MEAKDYISPADLYNTELFVKGSRVRVKVMNLEWDGKTQTGTIEVKFLDVPDENCYKICDSITVHPRHDNDGEDNWYYEGKFNIKHISKVPFGSELGKVLYGAQKENEKN